MTILFEISALEDSSNDLVSHYEIEFSTPVSARWLQQVIKSALVLDSLGFSILDIADEKRRKL